MGETILELTIDFTEKTKHSTNMGPKYNAKDK